MTAAAFCGNNAALIPSVNDAVWRRLCCSQWGVKDAAALLKTMQPMSAQECFRMLGPSPQKPFELRPLQYEPNDYVFIVQMYSGWKKNDCWFCKAVPGEEMKEFFEKGDVDVDFDKPLVMVERSRKSRRPFVGEIWMNWKVKIHIVRKSDQKSVQLIDHQQEEEGFVNEDGKCDVWPDNSTFQCGPILRGALCQPLFREYFCDQFGSFSDFIEVEPSLRYKRTGKGGVGIFGFSLSTRLVDSSWGHDYKQVSDLKAIKEKKVTFAHILECVDEFVTP